MRYFQRILIIGVIALLSACGNNDNQTVPASPDGVSPDSNVVEATLSGKVSDTAGNPIAEAQIIVTNGSVPVPEKVVLTTSEGLYEWGLPAGTFTITVNANGYVSASKEITITAGQPSTLDFTLEP